MGLSGRNLKSPLFLTRGNAVKVVVGGRRASIAVILQTRRGAGKRGMLVQGKLVPGTLYTLIVYRRSTQPHPRNSSPGKRYFYRIDKLKRATLNGGGKEHSTFRLRQVLTDCTAVLFTETSPAPTPAHLVSPPPGAPPPSARSSACPGPTA